MERGTVAIVGLPSNKIDTPLKAKQGSEKIFCCAKGGVGRLAKRGDAEKRKTKLRTELSGI